MSDAGGRRGRLGEGRFDAASRSSGKGPPPRARAPGAQPQSSSVRGAGGRGLAPGGLQPGGFPEQDSQG
eukprot:1219586-Alexandrium_andersonii.AAC.1